jgi:hypothetical protein
MNILCSFMEFKNECLLRLAQKLNGTGEYVRSVNEYLKTLEHQVYEVHRQMIEKKLPLTAAN